jgi:hypothetical protein
MMIHYYQCSSRQLGVKFGRWTLFRSTFKWTCPNQTCATPPPFWQTCLFTNSSNISTTICGSQFRVWHTSGPNRVLTSRRQLVPFFATISISNISTKLSITNQGWDVCRNGDCRKRETSCRRLVLTPLKSTSKMRSQQFGEQKSRTFSPRRKPTSKCSEKSR